MEKDKADDLTSFAKHTLMQQFRELSKHPPDNCSVRLAKKARVYANAARTRLGGPAQ